MSFCFESLPAVIIKFSLVLLISLLLEIVEFAINFTFDFGNINFLKNSVDWFELQIILFEKL